MNGDAHSSLPPDPKLEQARGAIRNGFLPRNPDARWDHRAGGVRDHTGNNQINTCYVCGSKIEVEHCDGSTKWYWLSDTSNLTTVRNSHPKLHSSCYEIWRDAAREMLDPSTPAID